MKYCAIALLAILAVGPVLGAPLVFEKLTFPSDGTPTSRSERDFGLTLTMADGAAVIGRAIAWKEKPEAFLEKLMASMGQNLTIAKKTPAAIASGKTRSAVPFVAQSRVLQKPDGTGTVFAAYYGFCVGDSVQSVVLMADSAARFKNLLAVWSPLLEGVTPNADAKPQGPTVVHEQTGPASDQFVSGVVQEQAARLTQVPFSISGSMPLAITGLLDMDLVLSARNARGEVFLTESVVGTYAGAERAQKVFRIADFASPQPTEISRTSILNIFRSAGENEDPFYLSVYPIRQLEILPSGLLVGMSLDDHNGFLNYDASLKNPVIAARPSQLTKISFGWKTNGNASTVHATSAGNAWLFVMGPESAAGQNYSTTPFFLQRQKDGGWAAMRVAPMLNGKPVPRQNLHAFFKGGCVDREESFVNDYQGFLYKLRPTGEMIPMGRLAFPTSGVGITGPAVTDNGDIWYALTTSIDVSSAGRVDANGNYEHRQTWFSVGDRSRLVRLRPGKNGFELGEIPSESIFRALNARGGIPHLDEGGLWNISHLSLDYKTGGLIVNDARNRVMFSLKPAN